MKSPKKAFRRTEERQRHPMQENSNVGSHLIRRNSDRFIPDRASMDLDVARVSLNDEEKDYSSCPVSPCASREAYRKHLSATMFPKSRILAFQNKPPPAQEAINNSTLYSSAPPPPFQPKSRTHRYIPQCPEKTLDAPEIVDDYYLNLMDWGEKNILAIALGDTVYLWDASTGLISELVSMTEEEGPVTSVNWACDGRHIAVGLNNCNVQIWDTESNRQLRTLKGHAGRVGSLAWNQAQHSILTSGGLDAKILNHDVRIREHIVNAYRGHEQEVCGLKWSESGQQLASGGNDNLLHIWDQRRSMATHRLDAHQAAVKALAWCPFQSNLLASGGGTADRCIKMWNTHTGSCLNSVDTGSQVCALLWSKHQRELLSSHGYSQNQLTLWKYPSMTKMIDLTAHTSRVLYLAQSPDGYTVASAAGDETLRFWQVFGAPDTPKSTRTSTAIAGGTFKKYLTHIR
ncbi:hypothetical protein SUGI_0736530 [Cryptomeria japonica]|uniref:cell division cycle 20.2, cofactor of APC complex n=1 Tax=Cryptomeria japonica TaxID=3369 RepID=UPI002414CFB8|nr:cell division cycle 20.2, cofactor of APC complex [Cryptomeria japonica]GLJ36618.1 hypothetical protein SUGI_0736530 [Cryptomeria japonica]